VKKNPTIIPVVAVALVDGARRILVQQRRFGGAHGGLWEFPGGKIEEGETPEGALVREVAEELGIAIALPDLVPVTFASDRRTEGREPYLILLYLCRSWSGEPRCLDGEAIAWFAPDALGDLAMPPLDRPLATALAAAI
jgi:8-oxo-dGTP diphosphatase